VSRYLFAWELGGGFGHARRAFAVGRHLAALGHGVAFAFRDLLPLGERAGEGLEWFQAPLLRPPATRNPEPANASEILLNAGFGDTESVASAVVAWRSLFALWGAGILVADYAPGALLAARAGSLPTATLSTGFALPPPGDPLPALRPWTTPDRHALQRLDAELLHAVAAACDRVGAATRLASVRALFEGDLQLVCNFAAMDPFGPRSGVDYVGPVGESDTGNPTAWRTRERPRVFAYLRPDHPQFIATLQALREGAAEAIAAVPGLREAEAERLSVANLRVFAHSLDVASLLTEADLCVCHGGAGVSARARAAGVPLALLPMQLEQLLTARRLAEEGGAIAHPAEEDAAMLGPRIAGAARDSALRDKARSLAQHYAHDFDAAAARAAQRLVEAF
jgi:UDP:flavonoid glycosyltransferase YjiC (YdhE family)